jgi:uncharacterized membrane protein YoaK (UPF0700 family)
MTYSAGRLGQYAGVPSSPADAFPFVLAVLLCLLVLAAIPVVVQAVRLTHLPRRRMWTILGITAAIGAWLALGFPTALDPSAFVIMQDGTTSQNLRHVYGAGVHSSPFSDQTAVLLTGGDDLLRLPSVVRLNRTLTAVNTTLLYAVAAFMTGSALLPLPLAWVFLNNTNTQWVSASEYPSPALTLLFLLACAAGSVIHRRRDAGRPFLALALATLALTAALAVGYRPEAGLAFVAAILSALMVVFVPQDRIQGFRDRAARWLSGLAARPRDALEPAGIVLVLIAAAIALESLLKPPASWFAGAFNPFNHGFDSIPTFLQQYLAVPTIILAGVGLWVSFRRPLVFLALPLSLLFLMKLHVAASGNEFNHWFRLLSTDTPAVLILAAVGIRAAVDRIDRLNMHRVWKVAAAVVVAASVLLPVRTAGNPGSYQLRPEMRDGGVRQRNPQVEVAYLLKILKAHPECVFTTTIYDHGSWKTMNFGARLKATEKPVTGPVPCRMAYRSLDCNFEDGPDCSNLIGNATEVDSLEFVNAPYGQTTPYLDKPHRHNIRLGIYRLSD